MMHDQTQIKLFPVPVWCWCVCWMHTGFGV